LYFQNHRGTYTTQARNKRGNRKSEFALRDAELWGAAAAALAGFQYPLARLDALWKKLLLNQFHDILPGSSIERVHAEAGAAHNQIVADAGQIRTAAQSAVAAKAKGKTTVFNSLGWERSALVELTADVPGATVQSVNGRTLAAITVPACGWTTIDKAGRAPTSGVTASPTRLENDLLRVTFNKAGEITSILDKAAGRELAAGKCNRFLMFKDVPGQWDAWNIDSMYEQQPVDITAPAHIEAIAAGPLLGAVRLTRRIGQSQ
jgi:alpha-mannosidase